MERNRVARRVAAFFLGGAGMLACYGQATVGPVEDCRTVEVHNRHDVEVCRARCNEDGCREHCAERERWSREHRCWVE
jgi:hypothetical protein